MADKQADAAVGAFFGHIGVAIALGFASKAILVQLHEHANSAIIYRSRRSLRYCKVRNWHRFYGCSET